jgi:hypothetical protein
MYVASLQSCTTCPDGQKQVCKSGSSKRFRCGAAACPIRGDPTFTPPSGISNPVTGRK